MIKIFSNSDKIRLKLQVLKEQELITDFRVVLRSNENLYAYILTDEKHQNQIRSEIHDEFEACEIEFLNSEDLEGSFYAKIFDSPSDLPNIEPGRRRFATLLDAKTAAENLPDSPCPIVTFYSYKGGMGRSTTLAAFAMHLAIHEKLNVVIIDCDFEAPGFTNFFLKNSGEENQQQGFIEYFFDKNILQDTSGENLEKYTWEVEKKYCGHGSIRIMPAGNLNRSQPTNDFLQTHLNHYIEGLARVDFVDEKYIISEFSGLLSNLQKAFNPDIILIDSRTGFNDIMGITAFHMSQIIVGFFRNDAQTLPGLHFFLDTVIKRTDLEPFLVNSILPQSLTLRRLMHNRFNEDVKQIVNKLSDEELDFPCFPVGRNENLEVLGTPSEQTDDLIDLIKSKDIRDYKDLFERLADRIGSIIQENKKQNLSDDTASQSGAEENFQEIKAESQSDGELLAVPPSLSDINQANSDTQGEWMRFIKNKILLQTKQKLDETNLYAENQDVGKDFKNGQFYFRECMNDLLNLDKVIILGSKGTGKSYIYSALKNKEIVDALKKRANKNDNYVFFNMVDKKTRILKVNRFGKEKPRSFVNRFWLVYTWQILIREISLAYPDYETKAAQVLRFDIKDTDTVQSEVNNIIETDEWIFAIENDMDALDAFLINKGNGSKDYITLIYDQLDEIVEPPLWNEWIPALIDFWRFKRYSRIFGKLFLRLDLFRKLVGITNINELENQAINVEWTQEEIYVYFFKFVLAQNMQDWFWSLMNLYKDFPPEMVKQLRPKYKNHNQFSLEEYYLRPLVTTFFGKTVDINSTTRMGDSYEWFYKNLKNADETISIRNFIDLIKLSVENAVKQIGSDKPKPILLPVYYTNPVTRKKAVAKQFEDLVNNETGNTPIKYIFDFIDNNPRFQLITLKKSEFETLLSKVIDKNQGEPEMSNHTVKSLGDMLITNGIVKKYNHGRGDIYQFAYLYKYSLGLKGN